MKDISGTIAAGFAILGVGLTAYLSGRAALKAKETPVPDDKKGKVKRFARVYGPAVASGVGTCALIVASDRIHVGKELALGSAASAGFAFMDDYRRFDKQCREEMGDEKTDGIHAAIAREQRYELTDNRILVYEPYTDQYIWTSREQIAWTMLQANRKLMCEFDCRLNYIIKLLGGKSKPKGDEIGWNWENENQEYAWSYFGGPWIDIDLELRNDGPRKCLWLFYRVEPETQRPDDMIYREGC